MPNLSFLEKKSSDTVVMESSAIAELGISSGFHISSGRACIKTECKSSKLNFILSKMGALNFFIHIAIKSFQFFGFSIIFVIDRYI